MEYLRDKSIWAYLEVLACPEPAPGGGSAAALSGAQGAALGAMVTELSIGRKKYMDHTEALTSARATLRAQTEALCADIDRDKEAYHAVSLAMKLPKETDAEKASRQAEIQKALLLATHSPLQVLRRSLQALRATGTLVGISNTNAASDLGTGAAMLRAAAQGAWLNILINLGGLRDADAAHRLLAEAKAMYDEALEKADAVFAEIEAGLRPGEG